MPRNARLTWCTQPAGPRWFDLLCVCCAQDDGRAAAARHERSAAAVVPPAAAARYPFPTTTEHPRATPSPPSWLTEFFICAGVNRRAAGAGEQASRLLLHLLGRGRRRPRRPSRQVFCAPTTHPATTNHPPPVPDAQIPRSAQTGTAADAAATLDFVLACQKPTGGFGKYSDEVCAPQRRTTGHIRCLRVAIDLTVARRSAGHLSGPATYLLLVGRARIALRTAGPGRPCP